MAVQQATHPAAGLSVPAAAPRRMTARGRVITRRRLVDLTAAAILSCLAFVGIFPYLYMLETAVKSNSQFNSNEATPTWPFHFGNFVTAWGDVAPYLLASVIVAACTMIGCLALGSITGFVIARYHFPGRNLFFGLIALLLLIPNVASLIPLFVLMRNLHLLNTYPDLIIPQLTTQTVFAVVLMKTYIEQLPNELFDAAHIDGASSAADLLVDHAPAGTTDHRDSCFVQRDIGVERIFLARAHHRDQFAPHRASRGAVFPGRTHHGVRPTLRGLHHCQRPAFGPLRRPGQEFPGRHPGWSRYRPLTSARTGNFRPVATRNRCVSRGRVFAGNRAKVPGGSAI